MLHARRSIRQLLVVAALVLPLASALLSPHVHATSPFASASEGCVVCATGGTVADRPPDAAAIAPQARLFPSAPNAVPEAPRPPARSAPPQRGPPSPLV
jgi:hypothetical protein